MKVKVRAVIFDMDGVITDSMPFHFRVWQKLFLREGIALSQEDVYKREGQKGIESVREIFLHYGKPCAVGQAQSLLDEKEKMFKKIFKRRFITGARSFVRRLSREEFKLGLVTGTSRHEAKRILPADLLGLFTATVCGCEVQNGKPHPEPYLTALQKLAMDPQEVIVIENAPFGIRSAKAAGLRCLAIQTSLSASYLAEADHIFHSFKDLTTRVKFSVYE